MQHKGLVFFPFQRLDQLLILSRAQSGNRQTLGLAAGKNAGTVRARQYAYLATNRSDILKSPAINTRIFPGYLTPYLFFLYFY